MKSDPAPPLLASVLLNLPLSWSEKNMALNGSFLKRWCFGKVRTLVLGCGMHCGLKWEIFLLLTHKEKGVGGKYLTYFKLFLSSKQCFQPPDQVREAKRCCYSPSHSQRAQDTQPPKAAACPQIPAVQEALVLLQPRDSAADFNRTQLGPTANCPLRGIRNCPGLGTSWQLEVLTGRGTGTGQQGALAHGCTDLA